MKKVILGLVILGLFITTSVFATTDEWAKSKPAGTDDAADIDTYIATNNEALDRLMAYGRFNCKLSYASASTITVGAGSIVCSNTAGTVRRTRVNPTATTVAWTEIDTGSEAASTTYYLYAIADGDTETFTVVISTNSTTPGGTSHDYYKRLGSFYNDSSSNITNISDDSSKQLGAWLSRSEGTIYQATTDGFVTAYVNGVGTDWPTAIGYSDAATPPTTVRAYSEDQDSSDTTREYITMPVKKGDYWKVSLTGGSPTIYWIPQD